MNQFQATALDAKSAGMLLLLAMVWGGTFFFAEIALSAMPPMTITLHRVFWATPVLFLIVRMRGLAIPTSGRTWGAYLVMGALNNAIPFSLIFWGQIQISSGLASILNATTAMIGAVVAGLLLKDEPLTARKLLGAAVGLAGVAFIIGPGALREFSLTDLAQLAVLGACLSYAFAGVWGRTALSGHPPLVNALGMLAGSTALMFPAVLLVDGMPSLALPFHIWVTLISLAVFSTALAYHLYFAILRRAGAANLLLVTLLIPPFAIGLGVTFLGEVMSREAWIGFAIIGLGFAVTDGRLYNRIRRAKGMLRTLRSQKDCVFPAHDDVAMAPGPQNPRSMKRGRKDEQN